MSAVEQKVNEYLRRFPFVKKGVKRIYQKCMYYTHKKIICEGNLTRITPEKQECFFGYYDKSPWSADERYLLALRVKDASRETAPSEPCEILLIDAQNSYSYEKLGESRTWNVQQGCMLQWLGPDHQKRIIYNDCIDQKYCAVILNVDTKEKKILNAPVYSVSEDGKTALGLDFSRLHRLRPGYGYSNIPDRFQKEFCPDSACIYKMNLDSGDVKPLIKYTDLCSIRPRECMKGAEHKVNHIMINPSGNRFMFLHRWIKNGKKYTRLITMNIDGSDPYVLLDDDMVSHCCWKNDVEILAWARKQQSGNHYYLLKDQTEESRICCSEQLKTDGHPSYSPDRTMAVTDCYPDKCRIASVFLWRKNHDVETIARVFSPFKYDNDTRCDLHPRWNRSGNMICIDSVHEGYRGMYVIKVREK